MTHDPMRHTDWANARRVLAVRLDAVSERSLCHGQVVFTGHAAAPGWARLYGAKAEFIGLGELLPGGRVAPKRLLATTASG